MRRGATSAIDASTGGELDAGGGSACARRAMTSAVSVAAQRSRRGKRSSKVGGTQKGCSRAKARLVIAHSRHGTHLHRRCRREGPPSPFRETARDQTSQRDLY